MALLPTPDQFATWQEWANYVVEFLADAPTSSGSGTGSPTISTPPPIQKVLRAASGAYAMSGRDAQFRKGPFHYLMDALLGEYGLTGGAAGLFLGTHAPLSASTGAYALSGQAATLTQAGGLPTQGSSVTTFHSIGLYWNPVDQNGQVTAPLNDTVKMRYKRSTDAVWRTGHDMWYDSRGIAAQPSPNTGSVSITPQARGSIVYCIPGTQYDVQFGLPQADGSTVWVAQLQTSTWSENFPIGTTIQPWSGTNTTLGASTYPPPLNQGRQQILLMDRAGTPAGYTLYDFTGLNAVAQAPNQGNVHCVVIAASYVILRGLKCVGGGDHCVWIDPGSHDIVIEDCDISGWGLPVGITYTVNGPNGGTINRCNDEDSGICVQPTYKYGTAPTSRVVVQRCKIHNPAYGAMPWDYAHPAGSEGILVYPSGGNHVFRYNEIYSTTDGTAMGPPDLLHFFVDCINSGENFAYGGSPGPDTDIYQNILRCAYDDAMETDGSGMNTRVWGNYMDYTGTCVSSTPVAMGPCYIFRNVYAHSRELYNQTYGAERDRLNAFKCGTIPGFVGGKRYIYHNTVLQPLPDTAAGEGPNTLGSWECVTGTQNTQTTQDTVTRNNIFDTWYNPANGNTGLRAAYQQIGSPNDFDYDMTNSSNMGVTETHGKQNAPAQYKAGNGAAGFVYPNGNFQLAAGSPGYDDGAIIPNFNDDVAAPYQYLGAAPDRGAHESGSAPMVFGVAAGGTNVTVTPLFTAGFEVGNMSEFYVASGGEELDGSSASGFVEGTNGTTVLTGPNGESAQASTDFAHTGSWSAKLNIPSTVESGVRVMRWAEPRANGELYFSWWVYFPQNYTIGSQGWASFMQMTSKNAAGTENPFWNLQLVDAAHSVDGKMHMALGWLNNSGEPGPQNGMSGAGVSYTFPDALPTGQWVNLEMHIVAKGDYTGTIEVWQNGVLQQSFKGNVKTIYPNGTWNSFAILQYAFNITPTPYYYYVDDVKIATSRIGG